MKITGVFKDYDGLRLAYGLAVDDSIDDEFDSFLKKVAGKDCILANYSPSYLTFDTTLFGEDPERPGSGKMVQLFLDGRSRRYGDNMGIDKLETINIVDGDKYIYCTKCDFEIAKETRYDYEPTFTYGDIYDNNIDGNPNNPQTITGTMISLKANIKGRVFCPSCLSHEIFDEVGNTLP